MPAHEDAESRVENILEKVDREVARRHAQQQRSAPPVPPVPESVPEPASPAAPDPTTPTRQTPLSPEPSRPISLIDPDAPTPVTAQELASGLAAARRRLAIVNTQLDELATEIETLNDQARRVREERLAQSGRPVLSPPPPALADQPAPPAPPPAPTPAAPGAASLPAAASSIPAPEPIPAPLGAPEPIPVKPAPTVPGTEPSEVAETLTPESAGLGTPAGMRVRPRPPAQSQRRVGVADQARLVAVELAVSGQTRGDVTDLLQAQYAEVDPQAILDSLFGPGTPPTARMSGT